MARSNSARNLATGKPHPLRGPPGWPKAACNSGSSGIEKLEPSRSQTRWLCQVAAAVVDVRTRSAIRAARRRMTPRGSRFPPHSRRSR